MRMVWILAALVCWLGASWVDAQGRRERVTDDELLYFPNGKFLKEATLGYEQAAASLTWIRALQYFGKNVRTKSSFEHMYHLSDVITDLDPYFQEPYVFGAFVMLTNLNNPEGAMELLEKGRENNPESWRLYFESGLISYLSYRDSDTSARYFRRATELPDAPEYTYRFAAFMEEQRGSLEKALILWQTMAEEAKREEIRARAREKVEEIKLEIAAQEKS